jgi:pimeloyl-ACP methyl ester carboxylesterase
MSRIFLIAGMGADTRIYNNIDLIEHEVTCVDWIKAHPTDTLVTYAQRLIFQYNITPDSVVIGNSMGGMMAVEIAKFISLEKVILVSSIRTVDEAPGYFSFFRRVPVYKIIPDKVFTSVDFLLEIVFGKMKPEDKWLFKDMLKNTSPKFLKWAMYAVLHWDNKIVPSNLYQISGDKDAVFPYKLLKAATIVKGGSHIMIFDKAKEINEWLKKILNK